MAFVTFRGETSIATLADKLFPGLSPADLKKAEAALLKANPQLNDLNQLEHGTVLRLPRNEDLRPKVNRKLENPDAQVAAILLDALSALTKQLREDFGAAEKEAEAQLEQLKSEELTQLLRSRPELEEVAKSAVSTQTKRAKELPARQAALSKALEQAQKDLRDAIG